MLLSAPIYLLKRNAKILSRKKNIPLHQALDYVAVSEEFSCWSLLTKKISNASPASRLLDSYKRGDLILLGARPRHGKTLLGLEIIIEAMNSGNKGFFFTLEYNEQDIFERFQNIGKDIVDFRNKFEFDTSDSICAEYIITRLSNVPEGTVIVVDYLQLLDQKRTNPELTDQILALKKFVKQHNLIMICLSQIHRSYDSSKADFPSSEDVRLPNPLDLKLFNKACFLNNGEVRVTEIHSS